MSIKKSLNETKIFKILNTKYLIVSRKNQSGIGALALILISAVALLALNFPVKTSFPQDTDIAGVKLERGENLKNFEAEKEDEEEFENEKTEASSSLEENYTQIEKDFRELEKSEKEDSKLNEFEIDDETLDVFDETTKEAKEAKKAPKELAKSFKKQLKEDKETLQRILSEIKIEGVEVLEGDDQTVKVKGVKRIKVLGFIPVAVKVESELDGTTSQVKSVSEPAWFKFLSVISK